jgi:hypothetical protein
LTLCIDIGIKLALYPQDADGNGDGVLQVDEWLAALKSLVKPALPVAARGRLSFNQRETWLRRLSFRQTQFYCIIHHVTLSMEVGCAPSLTACHRI